MHPGSGAATAGTLGRGAGRPGLDDPVRIPAHLLNGHVCQVREGCHVRVTAVSRAAVMGQAGVMVVRTLAWPVQRSASEVIETR
jgi:hypothetical protein